MDLVMTSEDLIVTPNPPVGQLKLGYPLTGIYALLFCQKDSTGTITPIGAVPLKDTLYATPGQTVFVTTFLVTAISDVFINGVLVTEGFTIPAGVLTFNVGLEEGTQVRVNQW
jgi:hypothetical protein